MNNETYLMNLLGAFASTVSVRIEQQVAELGGRSLSHEVALVAIRNHPNDTIDILSKVLGLTHSGAVRLINTLVDEGLVERHRSSKDARAAVICVTPEGEKRADSVLQAREQVTAQIIGSLTAEQQQHLVPVFETVLGGLTSDQVGARRICRMCDESVCRPGGCPVEQAITE